MQFYIRRRLSGILLLITGIGFFITTQNVMGKDLNRQTANVQSTPQASQQATQSDNLSQWATPIQLSPQGVFSWFPEIISDPSGRLHAAWSTAFTDADAVIYTNKDSNGDWANVNDIKVQSPAGWVTRPAFLYSPDGFLNMIYRTQTGSYFSKSPVDEAISAKSWTEGFRVSKFTESYFSKLVSDDKGTFHLFYTEQTPTLSCTDCYHLFYRSSNDQGDTWSPIKDLSVSDNGVAKPQAIVDKNANIFVVWEEGYGGSLGYVKDPVKVMFMASYDRGSTWTTPIELAPLTKDNRDVPTATSNSSKDSSAITPTPDIKSIESERNVTISQDGAGNLVTAWLGLPSDRIFFQVSNDLGKSWSDPEPIPGLWGSWGLFPSRQDEYSMVTDGSGTVHLAAVGRTSGSSKVTNLVHTTWKDNSWADLNIVAAYAGGDSPEWPRLAISNGNILNTIWFLRDKGHVFDPDGGRYSIWFSDLAIDSPLIPTANIPQISITTMVVSSTSAITPTPSPAREITRLSQKNGENAPQSESDFIKLLGFALLPVFLLVGVVVIVRIFRHH